MPPTKAFFLTVSLLACLTGYAQDTVYTVTADTILLDDGSLYMGQIRDSLFNGQGRCIYADGTVYEGTWRDGLWDGFGTVIYPDGDTYTGDFRDHVKEGNGTYYYGSGARYEGEWKDDRFNGKGLLVFEDGGRYSGAWKDDMKHGYGQLVSYDGKATIGYFYYDEYLGQPYNTEIDRDSTLTSELIAWGFRKEGDESNDSIDFIGTTGVAMGVSYSLNDIFTYSVWFDIYEHSYLGFSIGWNLNPPIKGKEAYYSMGDISHDVHMEGEYVHSMFTFDAGFRWGRFSLLGAAGICFKTSYQNCKANSTQNFYSGYFINQGESYYIKAPSDISFTYRTYLRYQIQDDKKPKVSVYLGYGNTESLFLGVGFYI